MSNSNDDVRISIPVPRGDSVRERQAMRFLHILDSVLQVRTGSSVKSLTIVQLAAAGGKNLPVPRKRKAK